MVKWKSVEKTENPLAKVKHEYAGEAWGYCRKTVTLKAGLVFPPLAVVAEVGGEIVHFDGAAADGSESVAGILRVPAAIDTAGGTEVAEIIYRGPAGIIQNALSFDAGQGAPEKTLAYNQLDALGIQLLKGV